jgi:hypothetical protein
LKHEMAAPAADRRAEARLGGQHSAPVTSLTGKPMKSDPDRATIGWMEAQPGAGGLSACGANTQSPKTVTPDHAGITWGRCVARSPEGLQSEAKLCPSVCRLSQRCCAQCDRDHDISEGTKKRRGLGLPRRQVRLACCVLVWGSKTSDERAHGEPAIVAKALRRFRRQAARKPVQRPSALP